MPQAYQDIIHRVERLHRRFLDVLSIELIRMKIEDINNVQALIMYNIGPDTLTVGELTARGYYLGTNVSYNLKRLVETEYVSQERSLHDKRAMRVKLTEKGLKLRNELEAMFKKHVDRLGQAGVDATQLPDLDATLAKIEKFFTAQLTYAGQE